MEYKYVPDNFNYEELNIDKNSFLKLQIKYKQSIENILKSVIDFKKVDQYIESQNLNIPIVDDNDYNFYRKFSVLGSNYIYLRNNIHIERLNEEELKIIMDSIKENKILDDNFISKTYKRVLFENDAYTFYGSPVLEKAVNAQSIVLEFAFNQIKCKALQSSKINSLFLNLFESLKNSLSKKINITISLTIYNSIPDIYYNEKCDNIRNSFK